MASFVHRVHMLNPIQAQCINQTAARIGRVSSPQSTPTAR